MTCPHDRLGRPAVRAALGGLLADHASTRATYLVMALGVAVSAAYGWLSPLRHAGATTVAVLVEEAELASA
ncbi:MAG: hypothetical protein ACRD0K_23130 [Egibacteraceae bacterium]